MTDVTEVSDAVAAADRRSVDASAPTLEHLVQTLGSPVLQVVAAPRGTSGSVGEPVVHGVGEPLAPYTDGVLLLVGVDPAAADAAAVVEAAAAAGYSAVVVKPRGRRLDRLCEVAERAGVALLAAPDDMAWRHLDGLISAALSERDDRNDRYSSVGIGDLFALANAIASTVGGAVTIEDPRGRVLAYSNLPHQEIDEVRKLGILGRQTPERPTNRDEYRRVFHADGPVHFPSPAPDYAGRLAIAVRAGAQLLGIIFVIADRPPVGPGAEASLVEAARVTAIHLLRARSHPDPERWNRASALRALLDGDIAGPIAADRLGLAAGTPTVVVAFAQARQDTDVGLAQAHIVDLVTLHCEAWHPGALCTPVSGIVYALVPLASGEPARAVSRFVDDIVTVVRRAAHLDLHVAVGPVVPQLDGVTASRRMADRVLQLLAADDGQRTETYEHVRSGVALLALAERGAVAADILLGTVEQIVRHDAEHATPYAETLVAYLDAFGDVAAAARRLCVHENTLRYRIRKAEQLFGLDLADADARLVTWLQLRLLQLVRPTA